MSFDVTILGCGNSTGVPAIGGYWGDCDPSEPKNQRSRCSIHIQSSGGTSLIIDTGPDFRSQLNREKISHIDAVLYTHTHADHINGIDELRVIKFRNQMDKVPIYASRSSIDILRHRFFYLFDGGNHEIYPGLLEPHIIEEEDYSKQISIGDLSFIAFEQDHGTCESLGYRFGDFAYSVDILKLDQPAIDALRGVKSWVVDCAAYKQESNPVHANLDTIYALNDQIGAETVYLTSLSLQMDYQTLLDELPDGYIPCYDGMTLRF